MVSTEESPKEQPADESLKGTCPFCLSVIDVHLDVKGRPYWRCWRCEVRTFATMTAFKTLKADGWIWSGERPLASLKVWLKQITGLIGKKRK